MLHTSSNTIKRRKAQGLPLSTIVIAALVLIVLVILILVFTGKIRIFGAGLEDCEAKGGKCQAMCGPMQAPLKGTDCEKKEPKEICCISI